MKYGDWEDAVATTRHYEVGFSRMGEQTKVHCVCGWESSPYWRLKSAEVAIQLHVGTWAAYSRGRS